jgi:hypothetical protein
VSEENEEEEEIDAHLSEEELEIPQYDIPDEVM